MWGTNQTSRRVLAATITAAALAVAGCSTGEPDDDITAPSFAPPSPEPSEPEAAPSTAEPSPEPSLAAPPLPPEATEQTPEGAVAFTEWWFDTLNYATQTGDTDTLRAASDPDCSTCNNYLEEIENAYENGGRIEGGAFDVSASNPGGLQDLGVNVPIVGSVQGMAIYDSGDVEVQSYESGNLTQVATLLLVEDGWILASVGDA